MSKKSKPYPTPSEPEVIDKKTGEVATGIYSWIPDERTHDVEQAKSMFRTAVRNAAAQGTIIPALEEIESKCKTIDPKESGSIPKLGSVEGRAREISMQVRFIRALLSKDPDSDKFIAAGFMFGRMYEQWLLAVGGHETLASQGRHQKQGGKKGTDTQWAHKPEERERIRKAVEELESSGLTRSEAMKEYEKRCGKSLRTIQRAFKRNE